MQGLIVMGLNNLAKDSRFQSDLPVFRFFGYAYTIVIVLNQQSVGTTCQPLKNLPAKTLTNNFREKANFIWQVADDILRGASKAPKYG